VSLTAADVAEIMRLVEQSGFDELTLEIDGMKLSLRRGASGEGGAGGVDPVGSVGTVGDAGAVDAARGAEAQSAAAAAVGTPGASAVAPPASGSASRSSPAAPSLAATKVPSADPDVHDVTSPLLGTFYRAPKPGAPPFVEVGAQVEEETVVAIIEVMKLMNTVRAGVRGTVTEILLGDGALAEYGETLLRVRKSG
jgi:acetyl-CoA carboxylase biotin carboxyl carrier protein